MPVRPPGPRPLPSAGRRPRLIGRAAELQVLADEVARARRGEFRCVLLVGEPGTGKTRLAEEVGHRAPDTVVLSARGYPLGSAASFGLWAEAVDRHLHRLDPAALAELAQAPVADLAPVVGVLAAARPAGSSVRDDDDTFERTRLMTAWAELFRRLAHRAPIVVELDDVALADASSLYLLGFLARTCADEAILVLATTRPSQLIQSGDLLEVVHGLEQDGMLRRLPVLPLDREPLSELAADVLGAPPPASLVDWLVVRSGGNPLFATELVHALSEQGGDLAAPALSGVPPVLAERIRLRLARLSPATLGVVEWLAVLGRRVEPAALAAVSGVDRDELAAALEELVRAGLVAEPDPGRQIVHEIAHPLVSDAVYAGLGAARRARLHRQAGRALLASGQLGAAAGHYTRSAEPGDDEAVHALHAAMVAAERAEAYPEALTILSSLVEVLPAGDSRWADVVAALRWDASWVVDHVADTHMRRGVEPLRALDRAVAGLADPEPRAQVKLRLAIFLAWGENRLAEAGDAAEDAVALFAAAQDRRGRLLAVHERAWIRMLAGGSVAELQAAAEQVAEAARCADDPLVASRAERTIGTSAIFRGQFGTGDAALGRTLAAARLSGNPHREAMAVLNQGISLLFRGRVGEALSLLDAAATVAGHGAVATQASAAALEMFLRWMAGDISGAVRVALERESAADDAGLRTGWGWAGAAAAAAEAGRGTESIRWLRRARGLFPDGQFGFFTAFLDYGAGACAAAAGRPHDAVGTIRPAVDRLLTMGASLPATAALVDLAEITGQWGLPDAGAAAQLTGIATSTGLPAHRALAELAAGWTAFGNGDRAAVAHAEAAVAALDRLGWPWQLARAQVLLARAAGRREVVVASLEGAIAGFARCGAEVRRERARAALLHQGSSGRRVAAAAGGPATLTPREREVARLTVAGRSARQIAAELFITPRTVEGHLARVYARLGVHHKVELAARAAEFDLTAAGGGTPAVPVPRPEGHGSGTRTRRTAPDPGRNRS